MALATNLGFPRIGVARELKKAVERYWHGAITYETLQATANDLRIRHWRLQKDLGLDHIPSNDFSFYDHILDMTVTLGLIPQRYTVNPNNDGIDTYFAMARGAQYDGVDVTAMEMTKWYDTNYHYIVPEFEKNMVPTLHSTKIFDEFDKAKAAGIITRPVLIGPATFVSLGKAKYDGFNALEFAKRLIPVYEEILTGLRDRGATWVQLDEPLFAQDLETHDVDLIDAVYNNFTRPDGIDVLLTTYFDGLRENAGLAFGLPDAIISAVHVDLCRQKGQANTHANVNTDQIENALAHIGEKKLSLGIVDGRNIWCNDLRTSIELIQSVTDIIGSDNVLIGPSCSLLHVPVDLSHEDNLDEKIKPWMAFAVQKIDEIALLTRAINHGIDAVQDEINHSDAIARLRQASSIIYDADVQKQCKAITDDMCKRRSPFDVRHKVQQDALNLPLFPTTTIGSFPQTKDIRKIRAEFKSGKLAADTYKAAMRNEITQTIAEQTKLDLDVLVHGEPERNDMVEYFGEQLRGFAFSQNGWVQSYGTRCVKPPIIYGDISRRGPMTIDWIIFAQSQTDRLVKGMLTGPITILQWSFVRDDQCRFDTAEQIALALRDEVSDLELSGIKIIQIDEAAFREGLPLRKEDWDNYLTHAVRNFRLASCCVADDIQIHTHMCYSEFNDIIEHIANMDADVISIETSRSQMELLESFAEYDYPNHIGPGVYDIHSPRIPSEEEITNLLIKAQEVLTPQQIWVNPDCGLKTRNWPEVQESLHNMVKAAQSLRVKLAQYAAE